MNLPGSFVKVLEKYGLSKEQVVYAAVGDLDEDFRSADTIVEAGHRQISLCGKAGVPHGRI